MKTNAIPLFFYGALILMLSACAVKPFEDSAKYSPMISETHTPIPAQFETYIREVTPDEGVLRKKVSLVGNVMLIDALRTKFPDLTLKPLDSGVDLTKTVNVFANGMSAKDYLNYLSALTGYEIVLINRILEVRSYLRKEWNLAAFASQRNVSLTVGSSLGRGTSSSDSSAAGSSGSDNSVSHNFDVDEWATIIEGAEGILGSGRVSKGKENNKIRPLKPFVHGIRSIGIVSAGGVPSRMEALDRYFTKINHLGTRQINISVQAFDVTLSDSRGMGIDWKSLSAVGGSINGNDLGFDFKSFPNNQVLSQSLFSTNITYEGSQGGGDALLNFLSHFGEVELLNQPNVTVRNGSYAYLHTGEEIGFIGEIKIAEDNNSAIAAPTVERIRVGVTLAVTPRVLDDNRVLLDIWPVVSSLDDSTTEPIFVVDGNPITSPKIVLQELSTQVITESGVPIQMGGFIRRSIAKQLQDLPWRNRLTGKLLSPLFSSEANELRRQELVLMVTPTIIDGV
ncbi:MAG: hypothetical protein KUG82_11830 [Pseudomonadales bacterium]|nr:hypothetical protein [Pseudomonadales bacterium]